MPLVDFNDRATWSWLYGYPFDVRRDHFLYGDDARRLIEALALPKGTRVAVIGAALGFGVKKMIEAGLDAHGFDTSKVLARKKSHVPIDKRDILRDDIGTYDVVVTEDVLPALSDREAITLSKACRRHAPRVVHWVSVGRGDTRLNWKTSDEWRALVAPDLVIARNV
jgi:hypothetical protein